MVKSENRPENRYEVLVKFEAMRNKVLVSFKNISSEQLKDSIFYALSRSKAEILTYNSMNIYVPELLKMRTTHQSDALVELNTLKCLVEQAIALNTSLAASYGTVLSEIDLITNRISNGQRNDLVRAKKGREQVEKEYTEAKHKNFYVEKHFDHSETDPSELNNKDPFGISGLVFDKD